MGKGIITGKDIIKKISLFLMTFIVLFVSLIISFCIPDSLLLGHISESKGYINYYEDYNWYVAFSERDIVLDNTDSDMLDWAIYDGTIGEIGPLKKALYINGYPRFWHGYIVVLRFLLIFINYTEIRYYNMLFLFLILGIDLILMSKMLNTRTAMVFLLAMCMGRFFISAYCFSYIISFAIALIAIWIILIRWKVISSSNLCNLFMLIGILENFFDFLTTPLLTWGLPIMIVILLYLNDDNLSSGVIWKRTINYSLFWLLGYAGMWLMKWLVGTVILQSNIFSDAADQIYFRTRGNESYPVDYFEMLSKNISKITLPNVSWKIFISVLLLFWCMFAAVLVKRHGDIRKLTLFISMALFPYVWYIVLVNHSQIHAIFTYKLQIISLFSYFASFFYCIDWKHDLCKKNVGDDSTI